MRCKAADDRGGEAASREASLSRASRISSLSRASRSSGCAMAQRLMPRIFVIFALFVARRLHFAIITTPPGGALSFAGIAGYGLNIVWEVLSKNITLPSFTHGFNSRTRRYPPAVSS